MRPERPNQARSGWRPPGSLLVSPPHPLRTGEIRSKRWRPSHIVPDRSSIEIEQRINRGRPDDPNNSQSRAVAVPPAHGGTGQSRPGRVGVGLGEQRNAAVAGQSAPSPPPARLEKGRPGVGGSQDDEANQREFGARRQGPSESVGGAAWPRNRRLARCFRQDEHSEASGRRPTVGGRSVGPQGGSDPQDGGTMTDRLLHVVQKRMCFWVFIPASK